MKKPMVGSYWVHKKTFKEYKVIAVGLWEENARRVRGLCVFG